MKKTAGATLLALAMILSIVLLLSSSAAAKGKPPPRPKHGPDLVISGIVIKQLPGAPPYVLEDESGHTPAFLVEVLTTNIGDQSTKKKSDTEVEFATTGGQHVRRVGKEVPILSRHGKKGDHKLLKIEVDLDFQGKAPPLGLLEVTATANSTDTVKETNPDNNDRTKKPYLPVVAKFWKALELSTQDVSSNPGYPDSIITDQTEACPQSDCSDDPLKFRFSTFDESKHQFKYVPTGTLEAGYHFQYTGGGQHCTADGSATRGPKDWPGYFWIDSKLSEYNGLVDVSAEAPPDPVWLYCNGNEIYQMPWGLEDLETYIGEKMNPRMPAPHCTNLSGHTERQEPSQTVTWQWHLQADVPKQSC